MTPSRFRSVSPTRRTVVGCAINMGLVFVVILPAVWATNLFAEETATGQFDFFESRIRPVLVEHCYQCHASDAKELKGGLLLDSQNGWINGGDSGPAIVRGRPDEGTLVDALRYGDLEMPPAGKLSDQIIRDFEKWIRMGAPDPRRGQSAPVRDENIDIEAGRKFWSFQPVDFHQPPRVGDDKLVSHPVDAFIQKRLEDSKLQPQSAADRATLMRRLYFDLLGLPPTPTQVRQFVDTPTASIERLVDQLLNSPQFGVRWGRHWLDVARYADSNGADFNATFHNAWKFRDYVVRAFNDDKPFDEFVKEQIAGDLLPFNSIEQRSEQIVATGFLMVGTKMLSERDKEKLSMDVVDEQINTVGAAFLGMTLGCCRCHDHKFDPIPTEDYYALAGIFQSTRTLEGESQKYVSTWPRRELPTTAQHVAEVFRYESRKRELTNQLAAAKQRLVAIKKKRSQDSGAGDSTPVDLSTPAATRRIEAEVKLLHERIEVLKKGAPQPLPKAIAVDEHQQIGDCQIRIRGEHDNLGKAIPRGFVQVASIAQPKEIPSSTSGRLELAEWIASSEHPLTARVIVNRIWYHLFGEGIVRSVDNFGALGERPTHPELLDYLAARFVRPLERDGFGWSVKRLVRFLVLSRTYQQSSEHNESSWQIDPENRLFWRANRRRLTAEAIRDSMLAISGQLDLSAGGSPVRGLGTLVKTNSADAEEYQRLDSFKRSMYLPMIRNELPNSLTVFDLADPDLVVGKRPVTNVPAQALMLLNSPFVMDCAEQTAVTLLSAETQTATELVASVYRLMLCRQPTDSESVRLISFLNLAPDAVIPQNEQVRQTVRQVVHILFASTEFRLLH